MSQPVGEIKVRRGLETYGGKGESLVKGVVVNLSAIALSVKPGGSIERAQIPGGLVLMAMARATFFGRIPAATWRSGS